MASRPNTSLVTRVKLAIEAVRGAWMGPIYSSDPGLRDFFGSPSTATGVPVNEASALTYAAVWAAVNCISGDIAALPLNMYRRLPDGGKEKFQSNPLFRLVRDLPNPEMTSVTWRRTMQAHVLTWGNGYSEIQRDGAGRPTAFWPITPDRVTPWRAGDGSLQYRIVNADGKDTFIDAEDMLHIPGLGFDGIRGYSVIGKARESVSLGMAAERFGETFFGNGATFGGIISYPNAKPPELSEKNYREALNARHRGVDRAHNFLMLYNGAKYEQLGVPPDDAQFLQTRQFQIKEIARWFNLPPHKLGDLDGSTHANIEQQTIDYYTGTLIPLLRTWEQELYVKLVPPLERNIQFFEHNADAILRGDTASRAESYSKQFNTGALAPNEIRESENRNPITGGDTPFVLLNSIPLDLARPWFQADIEEKLAKAEQARRPPPEPTTPNPAQAREIEILTADLATARRIAQEHEEAKDLANHRAGDLATEMALLKVERDTLTTQRSEAIGEVNRLLANAVTLERDLVTVRGERETEIACRIIADQRGEALTVELADLQGLFDADRASHAEKVLTLSQQIESLSMAISIATQERKDADGREVSVRAELAIMTAQAASLGTDLVTAVRDLAAVREQEEMIEADYQRVCGEKAALEILASEGDASIATLRAEIVALQDQSTMATTTIAELRQALSETQTLEKDARRKQAETDGLVTLHEVAGKKMLEQLSATKQAVRSVLIDAVQRGLVTRETDRARKQMTPDKLSKWVDAFYPMHEDVCRMILRPSMKAWLIASGVDVSVDVVLDRVIPAYIGESTRALRGLLSESDSESLPPALERICRRWETERAEALADRIMKEVA